MPIKDWSSYDGQNEKKGKRKKEPITINYRKKIGRKSRKRDTTQGEGKFVVGTKTETRGVGRP